MNKSIIELQAVEYLQTPIRKRTAPVKLDQILADRMAAFVRSRRVSPMSLTECE
jgi:hypothetical protein